MIDEIKGTSEFTEGTFKSSPWHIIRDRLKFQISICAKLSASPSSSLSYHHFKVVGPNRTEEIQTQFNGCFYWKDFLDFDFFKGRKNSYIFPLIISSNEFPQEKVKINLLINPWENKNQIIKDARFFSKEIIKQDFLSSPIISIDQLKIEKTKDQYNDKEKTLNSEFSIHGRPYIEHFIEKELPHKIYFERGKVRMRFSLIEEWKEKNKDDLYVAIHSETEQNFEITSQKIYGKINFLFKQSLKKVHSESQLSIFVEILPPESKYMFSDQKGRVTLDSSLKNIQDSPVFSSNTIYPIKKNNLHKSENKVEYFKQTSPTNFPFNINKIETVSVLNVPLKKKKTFSEVQKLINMKICLADFLGHLSSSPLKEGFFQVKFSNQMQEELNLDQKNIDDISGCFQTHLLLPYDPYAGEKFLPVKLEVTALDSLYKGGKIERTLLCNPWISSTPCYDTEKILPPPELLKERKSSKIFVKNLEIEDKGTDLNSFVVDKMLQLVLHKDFLIDFYPLVSFDQTGLTIPRENEQLKDGDYELTFTIISPEYFQPFQHELRDIDWSNSDILGSTTKQVKVNNGRVQTTISIPFLATSLIRLVTPNVIMFQMKSVDKNSALRPTVLFSQSGLSKSKQFLNLIGPSEFIDFKSLKAHVPPTQYLLKNDDSNIMKTIFGHSYKRCHSQMKESLFEDDIYSNNIFSNPKNSSLQIYKCALLRLYKEKFQNGELHFSDLSSFNLLAEKNPGQFQSLSENQLRELAQNRRTLKKTLQKFCAHIYHDKDEQSLCLKSPRDYIFPLPKTHILKMALNSKANFIDQEKNGSITRGNGFFAAYGQRSYNGGGTNSSTMYKAGIDFNLAPPPYMLGLSGGASKYYEFVERKTKGDMQISFQRSYTALKRRDLKYESLTIGFSALIYECVLIKGNGEKSQIIHLCRDKPRYSKKSEEWFFIGEMGNQIDAGILTNNSTLTHDSLAQIIRGRHKFNLLWNRYKNEDTYFVMEDMGYADFDGAFKRYHIQGQEDTTGRPFSDNNFPGSLEPSDVSRDGEERNSK